MNYNLIVAMCEGRGIGYKGKIPWYRKQDLLNFSKLTKGNGDNAVIMGSTTWKSLPKQVLPERDNLVLSTTIKNHSLMNDDHVVKLFSDIDTIIDFCDLMQYDDVWIIGGESIYKQFLDKNIVKKCYISTIEDYYKCDTFFPELNEQEWKTIDTFTLSDTTKVEVKERL